MLEAAFAPQTLKAYDGGIRKFEEFAILHSITIQWPPELESVTSFIAYLSMKKYSPATTRLYVAGIGYKCKSLGVHDITQHFLVKKMLLGMDRLYKKADSRLPITPILLEKIFRTLGAVCVSFYEACMYRAAFALAYFGFLRVGEVVADSSSSQLHSLRFEDVLAISKSVLNIRIRHSKADQEGDGYVLELPSVPSEICPVRNLQIYLRMRSSKSGLLFCHFGGLPLTRYQFCAVLQKTLKIHGLDRDKYTSHSFRIGAASTASARGVDEESIRKMGRWSSTAYKGYIRIPTSSLLGAEG